MQRLRRTEILIESDPHLIQSMAQEVTQKYDVKIIEPPHNALVMIKLREGAEGKQFYLGELLVTECRVQIEEALGIGLIQDHKPQVAYRLAVIDAAYQARLPEITTWDALLEAAENDLAAKRLTEAAHLARTKVQFSTLDHVGEDRK